MNYYLIYLPFNVRFNTFKWNQNNQTELTIENLAFAIETKQKLVLKPLKTIINEISDLKIDSINTHYQDIIFNLEYALNVNYEIESIKHIIHALPYKIVISLLRKHYDIYGLIENGTAIDYGSL